MNAKEIQIELKKLAKEGNENLFRRVKLAAQLFDDREWLADEHDGNLDAAYESIESQFFSMLGGSPTLEKLVAIFKKFPQEKTWREYRYNIRAMEDVFDGERRKEREDDSPERISWKQRAMKAEEKVRELEFQISTMRTELEQLAEIQRENARLEGKLEAFGELRAA